MRGRNSKPHNPRTIPQMLHRARVACCYKFTSILPKDLLVGAFDDARPGENWQTSFLRHNTDRACRLTKDKTHDPLAAAFGRWRISDGPLPSLPVISCVDLDDESRQFAGIELPVRGRLTTVAQFSEQLIADGLAQEGDILTFVTYSVGTQLATRIPRVNSSPAVGYISLAQLLVDTYNTDLLYNALPHSLFHQLRLPSTRIGDLLGANANLTDVAAFGIIVTRRTGASAQHNVCELRWAGAPDDWWQRYETDEYLLNVLRSWGASKSALLEAGYWKL